MNSLEAAEILLVDDSAEDAELTLRTLRKGKVNNPVYPVRDGVEALQFIFAEGGVFESPRPPAQFDHA